MKLKTPYFCIDEQALLQNLKILKSVAEESGARILLAQKAYACYHTYPLIGQYLAGTTASGLYEARLGYEEMGGETHVFSPAYEKDTFSELLTYVDHLSFNSFSQWHRFKDMALKAGKSCGLRVNPQHSTQDAGIYDPCAPQSRLGIVREHFTGENLAGIEGLHFHTLCEQNADDLASTLTAFLQQFESFLPQMKWLNLGGGHHITRADYDRQHLIELVQNLRQRYDLEVYLEPGEAVVLNAGTLHTKVVDVVENDGEIAILDASAACHMPDVIEMPYRPPLANSGLPGEKAYTYRLGGPTCLAGDVIGDYSFDAPLKAGDELVFLDMALYTMVKTNTFNGMPLPSIYWRKIDDTLEVLRHFSYDDFKMRL